MDVQNLLREYLEQPNPATAHALQRAIMADPTFDPACEWFPRAKALAAAHRHDETIRRVDAHMPGALLCPQAHAMLSESLAAVGDEIESARERQLAAMSLHLILNSGNGTMEQPWQVIRVLDEYAVLLTGRERPVGHRSVSINGRELDVHTLADGTEQWFELVKP